MNWFHKLFSGEPKQQNFTVYWSSMHEIKGKDFFINGVKFETGHVIAISHSQTYKAETPELALAMHQSDNPGTRPTSVITWS